MRQGKETMVQVMQFEAIIAKSPSDDFAGRDLFVIPGTPGLFRRVSRSGTGRQKKRDDSVLQMYGMSIIELVRDHNSESELAAAGFKLGTADDQKAAIAALPALREEEMALDGETQQTLPFPDPDAKPEAESVVELTPETASAGGGEEAAAAAPERAGSATDAPDEEAAKMEEETVKAAPKPAKAAVNGKKKAAATV